MDFLLSLEKRNSIFRIISIILTALTFLQIVKIGKEDYQKEVLLLFLLCLFTICNIMRKKFLKNQLQKWFVVSYIISVLTLGGINYVIAFAGTDIFNILLLMELIVFYGKLSWGLLSLNFVVYVVSFVGLLDYSSLKETYSDLSNILLNFFFPCLVLFLFRSVIGEKHKYEKINKQLEEANKTLKEYAERIEELAKSQERNRIAQEHHDSMGHSLMALNMNLEYAESVVTSKPDKAVEIIHKTRNMTKDCVNDLRKVVSLLKDTPHTEQLREAINELFSRFQESNRVRFRLNMDDSIENEPPDIKNCIYKTIREAVTNGIKHGMASVILIEILGESEFICLKIENNGAANKNIIKSNGLSGMEERIALLGGKMQLVSEEDKGFTVKAMIPRLRIS